MEPAALLRDPFRIGNRSLGGGKSGYADEPRDIE